ncbi:MAG: tolQ [Akkermansiaceae bacterium]|nr:tolQ [Akkermansiaceae bacterium]
MNPVLANTVVDTFVHGGWVMWPVLATFLLAVGVLIDRIIWWTQFSSRVNTRNQEKAREALGNGDFGTCLDLTTGTKEPFLDNLQDGLIHVRTSMLGAMQLNATHVIERSESRMWVLSTIITLAPLLGLLGTIVGIMESFKFVGNSDLAASKVSGGIGAALIATACGLSIAILCLLPYNYFKKRSNVLRASFERWINHTELLAESAKSHGHDLEAFIVSRVSKLR